MPKIRYRPLRPGEWRLLYELFRCKQGGIRATRAELARRLHTNAAAVDRLIHDLRKISKRTYIVSRSVKRIPTSEQARERKGSARPLSHYLLAEENLITEPATALIVSNLRLYDRAGEKMVNRHLFVIDMAARLSIKKAAVEALIEQAIAKKYVLKTDSAGSHIVEAERTLYEEQYLKLLARRIRPATK